MNRFHNMPDSALADELGRIHAIAKATEAELKALKDEVKRRGKTAIAGDHYAVTMTEAVTWRLDTESVRAHLGKMAHKFEKTSTVTTVRVAPNLRVDEVGSLEQEAA